MEARVIEVDEGRRFELVGIELRVRAGARDTGGALSVLEQRVPFGAGSPLHTVAEDKILVVIDGQVVLQLGADNYRLGSGGSAIIPAGTAHRFSNQEPSPARILMLILPGGHEAYLVELAGLQARGGFSPEALDAVSARYGVVICGAPDASVRCDGS